MQNLRLRERIRKIIDNDIEISWYENDAEIEESDKEEATDQLAALFIRELEDIESTILFGTTIATTKAKINQIIEELN